MVVAADVKIWDFKPEVQIDVVLFAPLEGFIVFAARARDDEELVIEAAYGVAVACVLHVVHAQTVEHVRVVVDDLEALLQARWLPLDVTAANEEDLVAWGLDVREIVLERHLHVDGPAEDLLAGEVVLVDVLRVALEDVDRRQVAAICDNGGLGCCLSGERRLHDCLLL